MLANPQKAQFEWTEAAVAVLRRMRAEGFSASQIAAELGGPSRNAVIGKAARLKIPGGVPKSEAKPEEADQAEASVMSLPDPPPVEARKPSPATFLPPDGLAPSTPAPASPQLRGVPYFAHKTGTCTMIMRETEHLPIKQRRLCGEPVVLMTFGGERRRTNWCARCYPLVYNPHPGRTSRVASDQVAA